jgi:hypothetical protein
MTASALRAKYDRLLWAAKAHALPSAPSLVEPLATSLIETSIKSAFLDCDTQAQRAQRALKLLLAASGIDDGMLYLLSERGIRDDIALPSGIRWRRHHRCCHTFVTSRPGVHPPRGCRGAAQPHVRGDRRSRSAAHAMSSRTHQTPLDLRAIRSLIAAGCSFDGAASQKFPTDVLPGIGLLGAGMVLGIGLSLLLGKRAR